MTSHERDRYAEAAAAGRAAIERALAGGAPLVALRVLLVFLAHGPLYSKFEDELATAVIERMTGMDKRNVQIGVSWLRVNGIVEWTPGASPKGGKRTLSKVKFPRADRGVSDPPVSAPPVDRPSGRVPPDPPVSGHQTPRSEDPPTEKETEKPTEHAFPPHVVEEARRRLEAKKRRGEPITSETGLLAHLCREVELEAGRKHRSARDGAHNFGRSRVGILTEPELVDELEHAFAEPELRAVALSSYRAATATVGART